MQQQQIRIQNIVIGVMLEVQEQCDGFSTKNEDVENLFGRQERLMSYVWYLPTSSSGACLLSWLPWPARPLLVSLTSPLCCSESEDSSDLNSRIYSSNSLCFLTCSFMSLSCPLYCTLSLTVCKCTPCQQCKPPQCNRCNRFFFSRGHDPYTHACKARPSSTDVGLL